MTTSSASRDAAAEDEPPIETALSTTTASATASKDATTSDKEADPALAPADVDNIAANIHSFSGAGLDKADDAEVEDDDDDDDDDDGVPRASIGDDSYYWDLSTMAPLNARSAAAIARLRAFRPPPFPLWDRLPLSRRAAVLVLLYADRRGDLRVVLTMRAASLRNYSGHAAFPGGKADALDETPEQIARREAWEEIGLPLDDARLPRPFRIEHLCQLPYNLAKTELVVRPCIALLHAGEGERGVAARALKKEGEEGANRNSGGKSGEEEEEDANAVITPDDTLIPRLDAKEVAAVFSAPFHNFLLATDEVSPEDGTPLALTNSRNGSRASHRPRRRPKLPPGPWYEGSWIHWHEEPWRMHFFYVPVVGQRVAKPRKRIRSGSADSTSSDPNHDGGNGNKKAAIVPAVRDASADSSAVVAEANAAALAAAGQAATEKENEQKDEDEGDYDDIEESPGRYKVWGMTARILVDAAQLAYGETPTFEHNAHFGDERVIEGLAKMGRLGEKKKAGSELTHDDLKEASKM